MSSKSPYSEAESLNRAHWDELAPIHLDAYKEVAMLRGGREILDDIELREVGDIAGKSLLHLQCHIGTDTLAWARRGAVVTGVDFSAESIACARRLSQELNLAATFLQANIYDLRSVHDHAYDMVYTSKGVLCWLRDLPEWGRIIAHYLKPGGVFYLMESHPFIMALEEHSPGVLSFDYAYFHDPAPRNWAPEVPDYADPDYTPQHGSWEWEWSVGDIVNALTQAGLHLDFVNEYDKLFFRMFPSMATEDGRWYRMPGYERQVPLLLTVRARKPA